MKAAVTIISIVILILFLLGNAFGNGPGSRINWNRVRPLIKIPKELARYMKKDNFEYDRELHRQGAMKRIFGGNVAFKNSFPYQVGILLKTSRGLNWCGGSLLNEHYVITAAHCLDIASKALIFLGAHEIKKPKEHGQQRIGVHSSNFIIHPDWDTHRLKNDVALIKLPTPVHFSDVIQPVKLPSGKHVFDEFEGKFATASGWGRFDTGSKSISFVLRYVEVPILDQHLCHRSYPNFLTHSNICTSGANGKSTCTGDSGGPLVVEDGDKKVLVGITSFGSILGCEKGFPGVYTRITSYLRWIHDVTGIET